LRHHRRALLVRQRCGLCAERVRPVDVLREAICAHCGASLGWGGGGEGVVEAMTASWVTERRWALGVVGVLTLFAGHVPLAAPALWVVVVAVVHFRLLRRPLRWLSMGRRAALKLTLKLMVASLACLNLVVNVVVAPLVSAGALVLALLSVASLSVYVTSAHWMLARRLQWDREGRRLSWLEWGPASAMLGALVLSVVVPALTAGAGLYVLSMLEIPTVSELSGWFGGN